MPTMWCELMLVPKIDPATAHQATLDLRPENGEIFAVADILTAVGDARLAIALTTRARSANYCSDSTAPPACWR